LRAGRDLYIEFATELYGRPITKADKPERSVGKKGVLSSGYGCGSGQSGEEVRDKPVKR
jgi:hypothetical protein